MAAAAGRRARTGADRTLSVARLVTSYVRSPSKALAASNDDDRADLVVAGVLALAAGAVVSVVIARSRGVEWAPAGIFAAGLVAWALVRLVVLHLAAPVRSDGTKVAVRAAWGPALMPFLLAAASPLDLAALAVSATLTFTGLEAVGMPRPDALRCVAWSVGGQLAVLIAASLGRNWFFLLAR